MVTAACRRGFLKPQWCEAGGRWYWIDLADFVCRSILLEGGFDHDVVDSVLLSLPLGGTFIDVGAKVGSTTLAVAGRAGRVLAIEPNPAVAAVLRRNLARNVIHHVEVCEAACSSRSGVIELYLSPTRETVLVRCDRLDELAAEYGLECVDVVRIDVEGAEREVLRGMESLLARFHPVVIAEMDSSLLAAFHATPGELERFLAARGYTPERIDETNWIFRQETNALLKLENSDVHPGPHSRSAPVLFASRDAL